MRAANDPSGTTRTRRPLAGTCPVPSALSASTFSATGATTDPRRLGAFAAAAIRDRKGAHEPGVADGDPPPERCVLGVGDLVYLLVDGTTMNKIGQYRKFAVAGLGAVGVIVSSNVCTGTVQAWLVALLSVATALGVYTVPNAASAAPAPPQPQQGPAQSETPATV